jgi:hypothetical protein
MIKIYDNQLKESTYETLIKGAKIGLTFGFSVLIFLISMGSLIYVGSNILPHIEGM